ncbi:MAG: hypothetical protein J1E99_00350 [Muribaculaceae bacterium]|nr:hypothetical protein [Muribaculaceae bacterium]
MIYKFRIVSDEMDDFRRDILIDADSTFLQLKDAICEAIDYDPAQMSSFFICDDNWEKKTEITLEDMGANDMTNDLYVMNDTALADLIDEEGQKLLFTFDYLTDRNLFLQLKETLPGQNIDKSECVFSRGEAPQQNVDLDDFESKLDAKNESSIEMDEDFEGSEYDDEDLMGLDELSENY